MKGPSKGIRDGLSTLVKGFVGFELGVSRIL